MSMQVIALTSANEAAMKLVASRLLQTAHARRLQLSVLVGVNTAHEAQTVYSSGGELWRVGEDDSKPELDALVDRGIDDVPTRIEREVDHALDRFLGKTRIAA